MSKVVKGCHNWKRLQHKGFTDYYDNHDNYDNLYVEKKEGEMMKYLEEAETGSNICLDPLRMNDMFQFVRDLQKDDPVKVLARVYYCGYSIGYRDGQGMMESKHRSEQTGDNDIEVK